MHNVILILTFYTFSTAILESLQFLLEERIYGVKNLDDEEIMNSNNESETIKNSNNIK